MSNSSAQHTIEVKLGQNGRVRLTVPAQIAREQPRIIMMKVGTKTIEMVAQEQEVIVIVNPDLNQCDDWLLGGEGNGFAILVRSPQTSDPECSRPGND